MTCRIDDISVIVPTRNEAHNVPAFLASLHPKVTLIVVDASDDGTDQLVKHLRPANTSVIRSSALIAPARQLGTTAAQTSWLLFSDADVCFEPGYFEALAATMSEHAFFGPKYATVAHTLYSQLFNAGQRALDWIGIPAASGSNMGVRRDVFEQVGGFRLDLPVNEDTELMLRLWRRGYRVRYRRELAVRSLDDRRLDIGSARKLIHSVSRSALLFANLYLPLPRWWLRHDWGYWRIRHARRSGLRDVSP